MYMITIFRNSPARIGNFKEDVQAIAIINCDDKYIERVLTVQGRMDLKNFLKGAKKYKLFFECEVLVELKSENTYMKHFRVSPPMDVTDSMMLDVFYRNRDRHTRNGKLVCRK